MDDTSKTFLRPLHGVEMMSLIGWPYSHWKVLPEHDTMVSMAGFALGPVINCAFSTAGYMHCVQEQSGSHGKEADETPVISSASSSDEMSD